MEETDAAKQEVEDLCSSHAVLEATLRKEAADAQAENDRLRAVIQQLQSDNPAPEDADSVRLAELQNHVSLLSEKLKSKEAALVTATEHLEAAAGQAEHERQSFEEALASAKQEANMMEDLLRSEAAAMEANMMDAFQKDGQRELDRMRQKFEAETKAAVGLAESEAVQAFAEKQAQATRDVQRETQVANAAAKQVAEMTSTHESAMLLQEQECAALQDKLHATNAELTTEIELLQAKHDEHVAAQAQAASLADQVADLQAARDSAKETLATERTEFETELAAVAELNTASQRRTAERLNALQEEVDRLQEAQVSLRDAEAELAALGLKCAEGVVAQAQVDSLRASNDAAQVEMARLRARMAEAEATTAEALRTSEAAEMRALQGTEQAEAAQAVADQARLEATVAQETEAMEVAAARKAMELAEAQQKAADAALKMGKLHFEAELRAAHRAHEEIIEQAVLTIVRDEKVKADAVAAVFSEKLTKVETEYEGMLRSAAERERAASAQLALLQEEVKRTHIRTEELRQVDAVGSTGVSAKPDQTKFPSGLVRAKPARHHHPRSPERSPSVEEDTRSSVPSTVSSHTGRPSFGAAVLAEGYTGKVSQVQIHETATATSDQAASTRRHSRSPHPSTPAPRKSHGGNRHRTSMTGPTRIHRADGYGSPADAATESGNSASIDGSPQSRKAKYLGMESGRDGGEVRAASTQPVTSTTNHGAQIYSDQALQRLDSAVGQWVRASAITPPPDSMASLSGRNDGYDDISNGTEEFCDFDANNISGDIPIWHKEAARANRREVSHLLPKLPPQLTCRPSVAEMGHMSAAELAAVKDFTIIRPSYGSIWCAFDDSNESLRNTEPFASVRAVLT
jgi:hypothetical protein